MIVLKQKKINELSMEPFEKLNTMGIWEVYALQLEKFVEHNRQRHKFVTSGCNIAL